MFESFRFNYNLYGQFKNLWQFGLNINAASNYNDFYEPRVFGRVFHNKGRIGANGEWNSNEAKKLSWGGNFFIGEGAVTNRKTFAWGLFGKIRFNSKFSVSLQANDENNTNQPGWAQTLFAAAPNAMDTVIFSRRDNRNVSTGLNIKYNFTNKMGITLSTRHSWSKVRPLQFYVLNLQGNLETPNFDYHNNVNQNYNYLSTHLVYTWQFAQGSFINIVWKSIGENFYRDFEKNYFDNLGNTFKKDDYNNLTHFNSLSLRVIYFLDYLTIKNRHHKKV